MLLLTAVGLEGNEPVSGSVHNTELPHESKMIKHITCPS